MQEWKKPRNSRTGAIALAFACALLATGCLYNRFHPADLGPQARVIESGRYRVLGVSEGTSSSFNLLWFIPVTPRMDYDRAVHDAVESLRGDNIIEVKTWIERQVWIVGLVEVLHVRGKVIQYEK